MHPCPLEKDSNTGCAPLVDEQWRWFGIGRLDPVGEQMTLVGFVPQVLVQVRVRDLLQRLDLIHRDQVAAQHNSNYLAPSLISASCRQEMLNAALLV